MKIKIVHTASLGFFVTLGMLATFFFALKSMLEAM